MSFWWSVQSMVVMSVVAMVLCLVVVVVIVLLLCCGFVALDFDLLMSQPSGIPLLPSFADLPALLVWWDSYGARERTPPAVSNRPRQIAIQNTFASLLFIIHQIEMSFLCHVFTVIWKVKVVQMCGSSQLIIY